LRTASAIWLRALFPVQTNSTRSGGRLGATVMRTQLPQQPPDVVLSPACPVLATDGAGSVQHPGAQQDLELELAVDIVISPIKNG
jgi:hypothetical protein